MNELLPAYVQAVIVKHTDLVIGFVSEIHFQSKFNFGKHLYQKYNQKQDLYLKVSHVIRSTLHNDCIEFSVNTGILADTQLYHW